MVDVSLVVARAGSKGLPGKHLLLLGDKTIIGHVIEYAMSESDLVYISTDIPELSPWKPGFYNEPITLIQRPPELAQDNTNLHQVTKHALDQIRLHHPKIQMLALLQGNCPIHPQGQLRQMYRTLEKHPEATSITTITEHTDYKPWGYHLADYLVPITEKPTTVCTRQQLPKYYTMDGATQILRTELIDEPQQGTHGMWGNKILYLLNKHPYNIEIDTQEDYEHAKLQNKEATR